jgi:hypothetical protein
MSDTATANAIKRYVTSGSNATTLRNQPARLDLAESGGILWATNRYWITPAARVAPLLEHYNLDAGKPGAFEVTSAVRRTGENGPDIGRLLGKPGDYRVPVAPVRLGGLEAHVRLSERNAWLAAYQTADGMLLGLPAGTLAWLSDTYAMQTTRPRAFELNLEERFGDVRIMLMDSNGGRAAAIIADVIRTIAPARYGPERDPDTKLEIRHDAVTENLGPRILGALMTIKLGS